MDGESGIGVLPGWIIVGAILSVLAASIVTGVVFWSETPCYDGGAVAPTIEFGMSHNQTTETLSIDVTILEYDGDRLTAKNTNSLTVQIRQAGADNYSPTHVLASDSKGGYPVGVGDTWTFSNVSVDGRTLGDGDHIRVFWTGPDNIPSYCPNWKEEDATVAHYVIRDGRMTLPSLTPNIRRQR